MGFLPPIGVAPAAVDLLIALATAAGVGWIVRHIGLNPVWGYLAAGIALGPFTPGYILQANTVHALANAAVALLLFGFGLTFARPYPSMFSGVAIAINSTLLVLLMATFYTVAPSLGIVHPLPVAATGALAALGIAMSIIRVQSSSREGLFVRAFGLPVVRDTLALALLVAVIIADADSPAGVLKSLLTGASFVAVGLIVGPAAARYLDLRLAFVKPRSRLWLIALPMIAAATIAPRLGLPAGVAAFVVGVVLSRWGEAPTLAAAVIPLRAVIGLLLFMPLGATLNPDAFTKHLVLLAVAGAVCLVVVVMAAKRDRLGVASATLTVVLVPFTDFNAAFGNTAFLGARLNDVEQALIVAVLFVTIGAAIALATLSIRRTAKSTSGA